MAWLQAIAGPPHSKASVFVAPNTKRPRSTLLPGVDNVLVHKSFVETWMQGRGHRDIKAMVEDRCAHMCLHVLHVFTCHMCLQSDF
jgi:hypothetical protein